MIEPKIPTQHIPRVQKIVESLALRRYEELEISSPSDSPIQDLENAINSYSRAVGKTMTLPPPQVYQEPQEVLDTIDEDPRGEYGPRMIFISFPLWFGGEKSDFCAEIALEEKADGQWISMLESVLVP